MELWRAVTLRGLNLVPLRSRGWVVSPHPLQNLRGGPLALRCDGRQPLQRRQRQMCIRDRFKRSQSYLYGDQSQRLLNDF